MIANSNQLYLKYNMNMATANNSPKMWGLALLILNSCSADIQTGSRKVAAESSVLRMEFLEIITPFGQQWTVNATGINDFL